jgi:hypothetical protein
MNDLPACRRVHTQLAAQGQSGARRSAVSQFQVLLVRKYIPFWLYFVRKGRSKKADSHKKHKNHLAGAN